MGLVVTCLIYPGHPLSDQYPPLLLSIWLKVGPLPFLIQNRGLSLSIFNVFRDYFEPSSSQSSQLVLNTSQGPFEPLQ